jgi:hypothetical protein
VVADIRTRPELTETLVGGGQLVDQRAQPRIIRINGDLAQPGDDVLNRCIPIDIQFARGGFENTPAQKVFSEREFGLQRAGARIGSQYILVPADHDRRYRKQIDHLIQVLGDRFHSGLRPTAAGRTHQPVYIFRRLDVRP